MCWIVILNQMSDNNSLIEFIGLFNYKGLKFNLFYLFRSGGGFNNGSTIKLSKYVGPDNQERALVMRGLPYKVQIPEIVKFFEGYGDVTESTVHIEEFSGKRTGSALVIFDTEEITQKAKQELHKKEIGPDGRYVELYDQNDQFMKKICNLYTENDYQ